MRRIERRRIVSPENWVPITFLIGMAAGTILLMLPVARAGGLSGAASADFVTALFAATSALCVTGLSVVDTATYWSPFGHVVLLLLFQIGGLGIMTGATLLGILVTRTIPLRGRLGAAAEMRGLEIGDVRQILRLVLASTLVTEAVLTLLLSIRFLMWGMTPGAAIWNGLFHACSAFMNVGFSTLPEGLGPHGKDIVFLTPLMVGVVLGGIGFPVLYELRLFWRRPKRWSIHTKLTLWGSLALTIVGMLLLLLLEWRNPNTVGPLGLAGKAYQALFHSVMTRSGGFAVYDPTDMRADTLLITTLLMFIGGGSASTAGGIRITTFLLLAFVVWSEIRRSPDSVVFGRRISVDVMRRAVAIVLMATAIICTATLLLVGFIEAPVEYVMFEVVSAFATAGLSTGLASAMPPAGQLILVLLMFVGRAGSEWIAAALALRVRSAPFRYPEERPIVG